MESRMKGYLIAADSGIAFALSPKITTIGCECCDLNVDGNGVDEQHAMIEYIDKDGSFILSDLQSARGTYVNNNRVNGVIILSPGDTVRFGESGSFEFVVEQQRSQIRASNRQASPQLQQVIAAQQRLKDAAAEDGALPVLSNAPTPNRPGSATSVKSRPQSSSLSGPSGANEQARGPAWSSQSSSSTPLRQPITVTSPVPRMAASSAVPSPARVFTLPIASSSKQASLASFPSSGASTRRSILPSDSISDAQEKEFRIAELAAEIVRLRSVESDNAEKDSLIRRLQNQLSELKSANTALKNRASHPSPEIAQRLRTLEKEVSKRRDEVLKLQVDADEQCDSRSTSSASTARTFVVEEQNGFVSSRRGTADDSKLRNDPDATANLVTHLRKELGAKEVQVASVAAQNEGLKKELRAKDVELAALYAKMSRLKDVAKYEEHMATRDKEAIALRDKFKTAEALGREALDRLDSTREELDHCRAQLDESDNKCKKLEEQLAASQKQLADSQRAEREHAAEAVESRKLHERFRTRLLQVAFTVPQVRVPEAEVDDDHLIDITRKLISERVEALDKVKAEKTKSTEMTSQRTNLIHNVQKFKDVINEVADRLRSHGLLARHLKQEMQTVQAETVDDSVVSIKEAFLNTFNMVHAWMLDIETKLSASGINVNISESTHAQHIASLRTKLESLMAEKSQLQVKLAHNDSRIHDELKAHTSRLREEHEAALKESLERERLLSADRLNKATQEAQTRAHRELNEVQTRLEKEKADLLVKNEELRKALSEKTTNETSRLAQAEKAVTELSELRMKEQRLRDDYARLQKSSAEDCESLKEQINQHVQVVAELNDRFKRLTKVTEDYELEIQNLQKDKKKLEEIKRQLVTTEQELGEYKRTRIDPALLQAAEKSVSSLKLENAQIMQRMQDQTATIDSLRQELRTAQVRLSDMKSEIPESHKKELDLSRARVYELEQEVRTLRFELTRLTSTSSESQQAVKSSASEVERLRERVSTLQEKLRERDDALQKLVEDRGKQPEDIRSKLGLVVSEEDTKVAAELTALGAQCKGERHHEVITRQKEAMNEMRSRIKVLEQVHPGSKHDAAIQQVVQLKKEIAELKASKQGSGKQLLNPLQVVESLNAMLTPDAMDLQLEKQGHEAALQALEMSESCYIQLCRSLASSLTVDHLEGQKYLAHIPIEERQKILQERERASELLISRIKALKDTISRKDELVQEHERLLSKLRQIEDIATKRGAQIDKLLEDLRGKTEECDLLRDYMHKTKDEMDIANRMGKPPLMSNAIVATSTPSESKGKTRFTQRHDRCKSPNGDRDVTESARRNTERMKRKNYEIDSLKRELNTREKDLDYAKHKITSLQQSLGYAGMEFSAR